MKSPINLFSPRLPAIHDIQSLEPNLPPRLGQAKEDRGVGLGLGCLGPGPGPGLGLGPGPGPSGSKNLYLFTVFIDFYSAD